MEVKDFKFSGLEPMNKSEFEDVGLEKDRPELTFNRFIHIGPEGLRRFGRAQATAARSHVEALQRDEQRIYASQETDPETIKTIMERFPASFRMNPEMSMRAQELVDKGEQPEIAQWKAVQEHYLNKQDKLIDRLGRIEESKALETPREFRGRSSGFIEDVGMGIWSSAPSTLATMIDPALGVPVIYAHMQGAMHEQIEKTASDYGLDIPPDRIFAASSRSAMINTPLELVGNLFKIRGMLGSGRFAARAAVLAESFAGEALTEFVQNWPEEVALRWALNPDLDNVTLTDHIINTITDPSAWADAGYEGMVGGVSGAVTSGAGQIVIGGMERLIHPEQRAINDARVARVRDIIKKPVDEMGIDEKVDLLQMVGLDPEAMAEKYDNDKITEIVGRIKGRLLFQAEPIESNERDKILDTMAGKLTAEQANHMLSIWDGIARVAADEGLIDAPTDFYKKWISEVRQSKFSEVEGGAAEQGTLNQVGQAEIPEFKDTNEAVAFGEKATPEQLAEIKQLEDQARAREAELKAAQDFSDERTNNAYKAQLYREALEASRGEHPSQRDKRTPGQMLGAVIPQDKRGAVQYLFDETPKIIHLFEQADASTLIHETGHILNEMLYRSGSTDYLEAAKWAGVDDERAQEGTTAWKVEELEKFAKAFELYMMEGRAPTMRLHAVFQRLKTFLLDIYRKVSNKYFEGVKLSDEMRSLFDRWVASEYERSTDPFYEVSEWYAVESLGIAEADLIKKAESDPGIWAQIGYDQVVAESRRRVAERKEQRKKKLYARLDKGFKRQAIDIVEADQFYEMLTGIEKGPRAGLSIQSLRDLYDQAYINDIIAKRPGLFRKNGEPVDVVANEWGYDTTDGFVQDLLNHPGKRDAIDRAYHDLWAEYEQTEHLEHVSDYAESLDAEIEILNEVLGRKKPRVRTDLKKIIREQTGQTTRQSPDSRRLREEIKRDAAIAKQAWNDAAKAAKEILKGKLGQVEVDRLERDKARKLNSIIKMKEAQLLKVNALKQGFSDSKKIQKTWRRVNRKIRSKSMLPEYRAQITNFLSSYITIPKTLKGELPTMSLDQFVASRMEEGEALDTLRALLEIAPEPLTYKRVSYFNKKLGRKVDAMQPTRRLAAAEVETIGDITDAISHMELNERKQRLINEKESINRAVDEMASSIIDTYPTPELGEAPLGLKRPTWFQNMSETAKKFYAELRKVDFIVRALDGFKALGPNFRNIMQPVKHAEDEQLLLGAEYLEKFKKIWEGFDKKWAQKLYKIEGISVSLTKEQMIMVALNSGNKGNLAALRHGNGFTDKQILDIIGKLNSNEQRLIVKTWDLIDSLFPKLDQVHRKLTGVRLKKVDGRYFPLIFDPRESWRVEGFRAHEELRNLFANQFIWSKVEAGHRIERKGAKIPVRLDFGVISQHLEKTIHDITHQIPVRNVQKILHNEKFRNTVRGWVGPEIYSQLTPWLAHIANPHPVDPDGFWGKLPARLRKNTTIVALGLKLSVSLKQFLSLTQTMDEIGFLSTMRGVAEFYKHPSRVREMKRMVDEMSPAMRFRSKSWDREIQSMYSNFNPGSKRWVEPMKDAFFSMIQVVDACATYPTWLGAYHKAMDGLVNEIEESNHKKAVEYADMVVRTTQPAASPKDLAAIQRGSNWKKLVTMFYTFFSVFQNRIMEVNTKVRLGKMNIGQAVGAYFYLVVMPAMLGLVINERGLPEDKSDLLKAIFQYRLAGIPFVRDMATGLVSDYGYSMSPVQAAGERVSRATNAVADAMAGNPNAKKMLRELTYATGYAVGLPSGQMVIAIDGMFDLAEGRTRNPLRLILREKKRK